MPGVDSTGQAKLLLAQAGIEAGRNAWVEVEAHAAAGLKLLQVANSPRDAAAQQLRLGCGILGLKAVLIQGHDSSAHAHAAATLLHATEPGCAAHASALGIDLVARHACGSTGALALASRLAAELRLPGGSAPAPDSTPAGGAAAAAAAAAAPAAAQAGSSPGGEAAAPAPAAADAMLALGLFRSGAGDVQGAAAALSSAEAAAGAARQEQPELAPAVFDQARHLQEVEADALLGSAQLCMRDKQWERAEELLGKALKLAEAAHGEASPALAAPLLLLAYTYSRSARVTFAEGLYREAAKMLRLDPSRLQGIVPKLSWVHPSLGAVLAWRYYQLLSVLPNRGSEAGHWEHLAQGFWKQSGAMAAHAKLEDVLGSSTLLKGTGSEGSGVVCSLLWRRALPMIRQE